MSIPSIATSDSGQREQAIDPGSSFIVQAPAGSGKTELLTQRYLQLLSLVNEPEEILAITFTRKAAAEMRNRIIGAIAFAESEPKPDEPQHKARTWELASAALSQDRKMGWGMLDNPSRLKIRTIDSFCLYLTGRMPLVSGMGAVPEVAEDQDELYEDAARNTLLELKDGSKWHEDLALILLHLDNDWSKVRDLLKNMLKLREHWLRLIGHASSMDDIRKVLESDLVSEIDRRIKKAASLMKSYLDSGEVKTMLLCASFSADNMPDNSAYQNLFQLRGMNVLPEPEIDELDKWLGVRELLLTAKGEFRKRLNKNDGFPAKCREKELMMELLDRITPRKDLESALSALSELPETEYSRETWQILSALIRVLKMAVGQLYLTM